MRFLASFLTCIVLPLCVYALTNVGGQITENTVWGPTGNPPDTAYNLIDNITIMSGATLTIQPGVRIQSINCVIRLENSGRLWACGAGADSIRFTSANASPAPGDWWGLHFDNSASDSSCLKYCIVEYAQYGVSSDTRVVQIENSRFSNCDYGLCLPSQRAIVDSCLVSSNICDGIRIQGGGGDSIGVSISGNTIINNSVGLRFSNITVTPHLLVSNVFNNNGVNIEMDGNFFVVGALNWDPAVGGTDCRVNGSFEVQYDSKLTIAPGNEFKFTPASRLFVYGGELVASGTVSDSIRFTSASATPAPGDWWGLRFDNRQSDSSCLQYCIVEYAEYGIYSNARMLQLEDSRFSSCNYGLWLMAQCHFVDSCLISGNVYEGIRVQGGGGDSLGVAFNGNTIINSPIGLKFEGIDAPPRFMTPGIFMNNNVGIDVVGDFFVVGALNWDPAVGGTDCRVNGIMRVEFNSELTIAPGNEFRFAPGCGFSIEGGRLRACGTVSDSIRFTSASATPAPGDWWGLMFNNGLDTDTSWLRYCAVEFAEQGVWRNDYVHGPMITVENCRVSSCNYGVGLGRYDIIDSCLISSNVSEGLHCGINDILGVTISANTIINNPVGIKLDNCGVMPRFLMPNVFISNSVGLEVVGDIWVNDARLWGPAVGGTDCRMVNSVIRVVDGGSLTVTPGNEFKFAPGSYLFIEGGGRLMASGTVSDSIRFTSASATPAPGDWWGLRFDRGVDYCMVDYCISEYAQSAIECFDDSIKIMHTSLRNSLRGVLCRGGSLKDRFSEKCDSKISERANYPEVHYDRICDNDTGIACYWQVTPHIEFCEIFNNTDYATINIDNNYWIYAENNWWGDSSGPCDTSSIDTLYNPAGMGNKVSDHVDYEPWLHEPPVSVIEISSPSLNNIYGIIPPVPNPFVECISLEYSLTKAGQVQLCIYNALGQMISNLVKETQSPGRYKVKWEGRDEQGRNIPAGVYIIKLELPGYTRSEKIVLLK